MQRLTETPVKIPFFNNNGSMDRVWLRFLSDLGDSLIGYWGATKAIIGSKFNADLEENRITLSGSLVDLYIRFSKLNSTTSDKVEIQDIYGVLNDTVKVSEINTSGNVVSISWLYVEDSIFALPNIDTENTVIITGQLRRK